MEKNINIQEDFFFSPLKKTRPNRQSKSLALII